MADKGDLQQLIAPSTDETEHTFQNGLITESEVLQATGNVVDDSKKSNDVPSLSSEENENSNNNVETTYRQTDFDHYSPDDPTSTEDPTQVPGRSQLNENRAVETEPPTQSIRDNAFVSGSPEPASFDPSRVFTKIEKSGDTLSTSGVEACVQVGTSNSESVPLRANPNTTTNASPINKETLQWCETYKNEPNIWLGHFVTESPCPYTVMKNKYTFSFMLVYMIMTTVFARLYFLNPSISNLPTCSFHQDLLSLNGACLFTLFVSFIVQLVMDVFNVHTRSSCIFNTGMFTAHVMLLLLVFARITYCQGSILDYVLPTLTLLMCNGYAIVGMLTLPQLLR